MSARVFLTDSLNRGSFCEALSDFLSAALFDVWLGGDVNEIKPDVMFLAPSDDPNTMPNIDVPIISLSETWMEGADDAIPAQAFDLLAASARSLIRRRRVMRRINDYADTARRQSLLRDSGKNDSPARVLVAADKKSFSDLDYILGGRHQIHPYQNERALMDSELDSESDFEFIIVKDDLNLFTQIAADPAHQIPVMFWSDDRLKIIRALEADAAGYLPCLSQALPRIEHQVQNHRRDKFLLQHLRSTLDMAVKDELTGLYNRRCLIAHLPQMIKNQKKKHLAVIWLDIDRFKRINDNWGHDAGDMILQHTASLLKKTLRGDDSFYRIGGEEFLAILPNVSGMKEAYAIARRLCAAVRETQFVFSETIIPVTISAGVGFFQPGERAQNLLKRADQALFRAKRLGRNQAA